MKILITILLILSTVLNSCLNSGATTQSNKTQALMQNYTPKNTAIIVIEFQKTWTEKGFFHRLIRKELERKKVVENTLQFLNNARNKGFTIVQAPLILDKKDKANYAKMPLIPKLFKGFTADTWKAEYTEGVYETTDKVVTGRCGFDACKGSNLEEIVADLGVQNLLFCGFTTEHCVEMTMNTLTEKGYSCILVADCTATKSKRLQEKVEKRQLTVTSNVLK